MTSSEELRNALLSDPEVQTEYGRLGSIFAVVGKLVEARRARRGPASTGRIWWRGWMGNSAASPAKPDAFAPSARLRDLLC
jgi:hypothetical protein